MRHDLDQHLIEQVRTDRPCPGAKDAEIPHKETAAIRRGIGDAGDTRMKVVMSIADTHGEGVTITLEVIKAHDYVVQPVWSVENTIVTIEYLGKSGIIRWRKSGSDCGCKTHAGHGSPEALRALT